MTFDNTKQIISIRLKLFFATVLILIYLALVYIGKIIRFPVLGLSDSAWTIILVSCYLIIFFTPFILNYQFIYYSDDDENIVLTYFNAGMGGGKKNSIRIHKNTFAGYKTESGLFGLKQSIILYQKISQGTAKYPPVHLSALNREQKNRLFSALDLLLPKS